MRLPICVVSMHRSGSSAVTRLLNILGVDLGPEEHLLPPAADNNPSGFWEHVELMDVSEQLLRQFGGAWHHPPAWPPDWADDPGLEPLRDRARRIIDREFGRSSIWGWKDPRICLTLPFWQRLLPDLRYVVCLRNPLDVARSLEARDGFSLRKGSELWLASVAAGFVHTAGRERLVVWYEDVMAQLETELHRLATFVGVTPDDAMVGEARAFIARDLRHHAATPADVAEQEDLAAASRAFYLLLHSPARAAAVEDRIVDRLAAGFAAAPGARGVQPDDVAALQQTVAALAAERGGLVEQLDRQHQVIESLHEAVRQKDTAAGEMSGQLAAQNAVIEDLHGAIAQKDQALGEAHSQLRQQHEAIESLQRGISAGAMEEPSTGPRFAVDGHQDDDPASLRKQLDELSGETAALRAQLHAIAVSPGWRLFQRVNGVAQRLAPPGSRPRRILRAALRRGQGPRFWNPRRHVRPFVSFLVPADGASPRALAATLASVYAQRDQRWELILAGREAALTPDMPPQVSACRPEEEGRAAALNAALAVSHGEFVAVLSPGDKLNARAVGSMIGAAQAQRADIVYSDEEARRQGELATEPFRKPDWSPELLLAFPYTSRLCLMRREVVSAAGGWHRETVAADDYAIVLAAARAGHVIRRVPEILCHRSRHAGDVYSSDEAIEARRTALEHHLATAGRQGTVGRDAGPGRLRVRPQAGSPLVSIVIATRDRVSLLAACVRSIEQVTDYPNWEIVIADNDSREPETLEYLRNCGHAVVSVPGAFNFSAINNAGARRARGEYLLFLNNDTEAIDPGWLTAMVEWASWPGVGCVGAKLLFPDGRFQHVGVTLHDGSAFHPHYGEHPDASPWTQTSLLRNYSAVTAACLMVRRATFEEVGGFDETFPVAYNDVVFCVRVLQRGYRNVYTPYAVLLHHESASRPPGVRLEESQHLQEALGDILWNDPYDSPPLGGISGPRKGHGRLGRLTRASARAAAVLSSATSERAVLRTFPEVRREAKADDQIRWIDRIEIDGDVRVGLFMHPVARVTYRVPGAARGWFVAWAGLAPEVWEKNLGGVIFRISASVGGAERYAREWRIDPHSRPGHRRWRRIRLRLPRTPDDVELTLTTTVAPGVSPAYGWAVWGDPQLVVGKPPATVIRRQADVVRALGLRGAALRYARLLRGRGIDPLQYDGWFRQTTPTAERQAALRRTIDTFGAHPRISIITPVYNTDPKWLEKCVESVIAQVYPHWELCLANDGSSRGETLACLEHLGGRDDRIRVVHLARNQGIAAASNAALAAATGDFVALLDHDDELAPDALFEVARTLNEHPDADFVYTDEDKLEFDGSHSEPFFKPDWSPEYLRSTMYVGHLCVYRRDIVEAAGRFRSAYDGAQDYDLALRVSERTAHIHHVPRVLYHWRKIQGSAAGDAAAKPWGFDAARRALADHVSRLPIPAEVKDEPGRGFWRVQFTITGDPLVSIVIPTDGRIAELRSGGRRDLLLECVRSIVERTTYRRYELVIADNGRLSREALEFLDGIEHRRAIYRLQGRFNFAAKVNFAAAHATGEHVLLLNDDTEVISGDWLSAMLEFSQQREIGAVGGKLFYPDGRLQHVGVVLGIGGGACHVLAGLPGDSPGYFGGALVIRNYSAVTGACCMTRRAVFEEVGGFDERFALDFNDVDYCLRVRARGYRVVGTPFARLVHYEGATFGSREHVVNPAEIAALTERWGTIIASDPFYNPNLTRSALDYSLRLTVPT